MINNTPGGNDSSRQYSGITPSFVQGALQVGVSELTGSTDSTSSTTTTTSTSEDGTTTTTSTTGTQSQTSIPINPYTKAANVLSNASVIQNSLANLSVNENFSAYYTTMVKPPVDTIYFLSLSLQGLAAVANTYQSNNYGKKHEIKKALDLSYEVLDQLEKAINLLDCTLECLIERAGCCPKK